MVNDRGGGGWVGVVNDRGGGGWVGVVNDRGGGGWVGVVNDTTFHIIEHRSAQSSVAHRLWKPYPHPSRN